MHTNDTGRCVYVVWGEAMFDRKLAVLSSLCISIRSDCVPTRPGVYITAAVAGMLDCA